MQHPDNLYHAVNNLRRCRVEFVVAQHAGLEHEFAVESLERFHHTINVIARRRLVDEFHQRVGWRVNLHYRVVDFAQGIEHPWYMYTCCVAQHRYLGLRIILVPQMQGVVYNLRKVRIKRRLAVAAEGDAVNARALGSKLFEHPFQVASHLGRRGQHRVVTAVAVPAAFAVDAVEIANLALFGQQIDAQ